MSLFSKDYTSDLITNPIKDLNDKLIEEKIQTNNLKNFQQIKKVLDAKQVQEMKVIYIPPSDKPNLGSIPYIKNYLKSNDSLNVKHCYAVAIKTVNGFSIEPSSVINPNPKDLELISTQYVYCYDDKKVLNTNLSLNDIIRVEFTKWPNEARIIAIVGNRLFEENEKTSSSKPFSNSIGTTVGDTSGTGTSGDGRQKDSQPETNDNECGGIGGYTKEDCKSGILPGGSRATLHPKFFDNVSNLLNEIKTKENFNIKVGESKRSKNKQLEMRKRNCPNALENLGEEKFKTSPWPVILENGPCKDTTSIGAVEGVWASNHISGLAIDFVMDIPDCPAKNVNANKYHRCLQTSKVYNLINKYASKYGLKNLTGNFAEPWHWSYNGG